MNTRSSGRGRDPNRNNAPSSRTTSIATDHSTTRQQRSWHPRSLRSLTRRSVKSPQSDLSLSDQAILLRRHALAAAQRGDYESAIALYSQVIAVNPESANDYNNRGLVYFHNGQVEQALADYNKALELSPQLDSVYNNRANYFAAQGLYIDAILDYDMAIDLNPSNIRAWINQGITFRDLDMYEQAIENFELALCLNGTLDGHIYAERGRTYHLWGDWNCAVADYQRAIAHLAPEETSTPQAIRLRNQVERWLTELLDPIL